VEAHARLGRGAACGVGLVDALLEPGLLPRGGAAGRRLDRREPRREPRRPRGRRAHVEGLEVAVVGVEAREEADEGGVDDGGRRAQQKGPALGRERRLEPRELLDGRRPQRRLAPGSRVVQPLVAVGVEGAARAEQLGDARVVLGAAAARGQARELALEAPEDVERLGDRVAVDSERRAGAARRDAQVGGLLGGLARIAAQVDPSRRVPQLELLHPEPDPVREGAPGVGVAEEGDGMVVRSWLAWRGPRAAGTRDAVPGEGWWCWRGGGGGGGRDGERAGRGVAEGEHVILRTCRHVMQMSRKPARHLALA